ncbi:TPA: hypothetical protein SUB30_005246 [Bacillus pseudomycoides]|nr:hypothetical protein [Bacillus pseudomycoides]
MDENKGLLLSNRCEFIMPKSNSFIQYIYYKYCIKEFLACTLVHTYLT